MTTTLALLALSVALRAAPASGPIQVGPVMAARGASASGWLDIGAPPGSGEPVIRLPITIVNGAASGPVLGLIGGTHGSEYTSVIAMPRIAARLDPAKMRGAVIMVHMANPPAFYGRRIYYSPDGKNLNRVYPGRADGTMSERIAAAITSEIIGRATHLADMHCGDGNESLRPYSYAIVSGNRAVDEATRRMALAFGLDHIVIDRERPRDPNASSFTSNTAILRGKPAITTESGGMGLTDEASVEAQVTGALSVIAHLGIMDLPSARVTRPVWIDRSEVVRAPVEGIWRPVVEKAQVVAEGALLGRIVDPFGKELATVRAPFGGEILYVVGTPPAGLNEPLAYVGRISETEPGY